MAFVVPVAPVRLRALVGLELGEVAIDGRRHLFLDNGGHRLATERAIAFTHSRPSACIAFTISNAIGRLVIVAACCDIGVLLCAALDSYRGVPLFLPDTEIDTSPGPWGGSVLRVKGIQFQFRTRAGRMSNSLDPLNVEALEKSVNDSAGRVSTIWGSFLVFGLYLVVAAGGVTDRHLMLENPVKLPVLNIDLPLVGFFFLCPHRRDLQ
jgi:hypothetical protein